MLAPSAVEGLSSGEAVEFALRRFGGLVGSGALEAKASWISFLAGTGAIVLTFLAGAELDPTVFARKWKEPFRREWQRRKNRNRDDNKQDGFESKWSEDEPEGDHGSKYLLVKKTVAESERQIFGEEDLQEMP
jgi:hypothetical protein